METNMSARLLRIAREALAKRAGAAEQEGAEAGFTLIELMVVLLIMAILLAIAIPTFLGVKGGAQDRAAQSNLSNALISAKSTYATNSSYLQPASLVAVMSTQEPSLSFTTGAVATSATNQVSLSSTTSGGGQVLLVAYSPNGGGTCWGISDWDGTGTTSLGSAPKGTGYTAWKASTAQPCQASTMGSAAKASDWTTQYPSSPLSSL
jgi:type IV pilus assembly protein PilA